MICLLKKCHKNDHVSYKLSELRFVSQFFTIHPAAAEAGVKLMCPSWIDAIWKVSQTVNVHADDDQFKKHQCLPFQNLTVSSTGLSNAAERQQIEKLVKENGGVFTGKLNLSNTDILICCGQNIMSSDKYKAARQHRNIKCVNLSWVTDSVEKGYALPHHQYQVQKITSTPTKSDEPVNPEFSVLSAIGAPNMSQRTWVEETLASPFSPGGEKVTKGKRKAQEDTLAKLLEGVNNTNFSKKVQEMQEPPKLTPQFNPPETSTQQSTFVTQDVETEISKIFENYKFLLLGFEEEEYKELKENIEAPERSRSPQEALQPPQKSTSEVTKSTTPSSSRMSRVLTPVNHLTPAYKRFLDSAEKPFSQVTPVNKIMKHFRESNLNSSLPREKKEYTLPQPWMSIKTPDTPLGACMTPNPSPGLRKQCEYWLQQFPDKESPKSNMSTGSIPSVPNTPENPQLASRLQQLEDMLSASGGGRRQSRNFQSTVPVPARNTEFKDSQPCTVGWDFTEQEEEFEFGNPKSEGKFSIPQDRDTELRIQRMHWWRTEITQRGYGAFNDMRAIIVAEKREPIVRVIEAGGGVVIDVKPPFDDTVHATHCLLEQRSVEHVADYIPLARQGVYLVNTIYISDYLHQPNKDIRDCDNDNIQAQSRSKRCIVVQRQSVGLLGELDYYDYGGNTTEPSPTVTTTEAGSRRKIIRVPKKKRKYYVTKFSK
ncbi:hypothetical protein JTB14_036421 [Gonioctena quinquepunctata]|nr:hypothetical protein JTB14_036421 [Gonioctena quinquepunctata]